MLNFKLNVGLNVQETMYPIYFDRKNICVHCGAEKSLVFVDIFGRETRQEIHPFDHIKCKACGRNYSILWQRDDEKKMMYPVASDPSIKREFINLVSYPIMKQTNSTTNIE